LFQATAAFLAEGLDAGELLLVIATPAHHIGFLAALTSRRFDPDALCAAGWLTLADAQGCLALFIVGRMPDETLFKACIGDLLDQIPPSGPRGRLRVYGEMVDLLWSD